MFEQHMVIVTGIQTIEGKVVTVWLSANEDTEAIKFKLLEPVKEGSIGFGRCMVTFSSFGAIRTIVAA